MVSAARTSSMNSRQWREKSNDEAEVDVDVDVDGAGEGAMGVVGGVTRVGAMLRIRVMASAMRPSQMSSRITG